LIKKEQLSYDLVPYKSLPELADYRPCTLPLSSLLVVVKGFNNLAHIAKNQNLRFFFLKAAWIKNSRWSRTPRLYSLDTGWAFTFLSREQNYNYIFNVYDYRFAWHNSIVNPFSSFFIFKPRYSKLLQLSVQSLKRFFFYRIYPLFIFFNLCNYSPLYFTFFKKKENKKLIRNHNIRSSSAINLLNLNIFLL
jgi:hypothetical protein